MVYSLLVERRETARRDAEAGSRQYGRAGGADGRSRSGQIEDGSMKLVECGGTRLQPRLSRNAERAARSQNQFESIKARRLSRPAPRLATAAGTSDATASRQPHSSHSS